MPAILHPKARHLQVKDPRIVHNFKKRYRKLIADHDILGRVKKLESQLQ
jgi:hypothetical protein